MIARNVFLYSTLSTPSSAFICYWGRRHEAKPLNILDACLNHNDDYSWENVSGYVGELIITPRKQANAMAMPQYRSSRLSEHPL